MRTWIYFWELHNIQLENSALGLTIKIIFTSLAKGGYAFGGVGLSVCLFVDNITQKVMNGLGWILRGEGGSWVVQWKTD